MAIVNDIWFEIGEDTKVVYDKLAALDDRLLASARNRTNAGLGLEGDIKNNRLAIVDARSVAKDKKWLLKMIDWLLKLVKKIDVNNRSDALANNQEDFGPVIGENVGANMFDSRSGKELDADLILDNAE